MSDHPRKTGAVNIASIDACELVAPPVALGIDGLTLPNCSNAATLLETERGPIDFAIASATAVCKPAQNSGDLKAAVQSTEDLSYRIRHICIHKKQILKFFPQFYVQQSAKQLAM